MDDRTLERDFAAFRDRASLDALGRVFDRVAPELLGVARGLVPDADVAEDLVQATFLTAIERRERWDAGRRLVPWLVGILTRHARTERRRRGSEPRTERCSELLANEPLDPGEAAELQRELTRSLDGLPEAQRVVAALYLRHDLTPAEIAAALGRTPSTVRTQLRRALARLRQRLPQALAIAFLVDPRGLDAIRSAVLARAESSLSPTSPVLDSVTSTKGFFMLQLGALAGGLAAVALLFPPRPAEPSDPTTALAQDVRSSVASAPRGASPTPRRVVAPRPARTERDDTVAIPSVLPLWIEVRDPNGAPVEGALIALSSVKLREEPDRVYGWRADVVAASETTAEGQGQLRIPAVWEGRHPIAVSFSVSHRDFAPFCSDFVELASARTAVVLEWGASLRLVGRLADGAPVDTSRLRAELGVSSRIEPGDFRPAGPDGLETAGLAPGVHHVALVYTARDGARFRSAMAAVEVGAGQLCERSLDLVPVATLRGRLDERVPRPVANGEVVAHQSSGGERLLARTLRARVAADGTFELGDLGPGVVEVAVLSEGFTSATRPPDTRSSTGPWYEGAEHPAVTIDGPVAELVVPMVETAEVELVCNAPDGRPVEGLELWTRVIVRWRDGRWQYFERPPIGTTDAEGRARLTGVPPGLHSVSALHPEWRLPSEPALTSELPIPGDALRPGERRRVTLPVVPRATNGSDGTR